MLICQFVPAEFSWFLMSCSGLRGCIEIEDGKMVGRIVIFVQNRMITSLGTLLCGHLRPISQELSHNGVIRHTVGGYNFSNHFNHPFKTFCISINTHLHCESL